MLSVMLQRGSILIVWTDHSREREVLIGAVDRIGTSARWVAFNASPFSIVAAHYIDHNGLLTSEHSQAKGQPLSGHSLLAAVSRN